MLFETPEDTYKAYQKFLKKEEYKKAYRCLEKMLHEFPDDMELLEDVVDLCVLDWRRPDIGKRWMIQLMKQRTIWLDYIKLSHIEAEHKNFTLSKEYLKKAKCVMEINAQSAKMGIKAPCLSKDYWR